VAHPRRLSDGLRRGRRRRDTPATYLLRGIPPRLWRQAKIRAASEGRTLRDVLLDLLDRWTSETVQPAGPRLPHPDRDAGEPPTS
jgi:hypothetical protein